MASFILGMGILYQIITLCAAPSSTGTGLLSIIIIFVNSVIFRNDCPCMSAILGHKLFANHIS